MSIIPKKISESSAHERALYARNFLNLDLTGSETDAQITSMINLAQPNSEMIFVMADDAPENSDAEASETLIEAGQPLSAPAPRLKGSLGRGDPRAVILIQVGEGDNGGDDVFVGVNGVVWQLKRGVDLNVPYRVVVALDNSIQDIVRHDMEKDEVIVNKARRFNYVFVQQPSREEIEEWHAIIDNEEMA